MLSATGNQITKCILHPVGNKRLFVQCKICDLGTLFMRGLVPLRMRTRLSTEHNSVHVAWHRSFLSSFVLHGVWEGLPWYVGLYFVMWVYDRWQRERDRPLTWVYFLMSEISRSHYSIVAGSLLAWLVRNCFINQPNHKTHRHALQRKMLGGNTYFLFLSWIKMSDVQVYAFCGRGKQ